MAAPSTRTRSSTPSRARARSGRAATPAAKGAPRALWKGAISFGLVHVPVALYPATREHGIDFDWLDKRSMDPVGYKRVNKRTGREVSRDHIVKGVDTGGGDYVLLSEDEITRAYPRTTRTIAIESFVPADAIPFIYLDRPYYLAPVDRGAKVYALLREALRQAGKVGVARVVIQTREHLAMLVPTGPGLVLNLLRWSEDIRPWSALDLPPQGLKQAGLSSSEMKMATRLIEDMGDAFDPADFHDAFTERIRALIQRKRAAGKSRHVAETEPLEEAAPEESNVVDLTELLQRSLRGGKGAASTAKAGAKRATPTAKTAKTASKAPARKTAARAATRRAA